MTQVSKERTRIVVLVASLPRSGSTVMAELLRSYPESVLFFEPDHKTQYSDCSAIPSCIANYIKDVALCQFDSEFDIWLRNGFFFRYFHPDYKSCLENETCRHTYDLRSKCKNASVTITKVVRYYLSDLHDLLKDDHLDARIIHLIRDPRGSFLSASRFKWDRIPAVDCFKLEADTRSYDYLRKKYPKQIMQVHYEDFCLKPQKTAETIFQFAFDRLKLPENTLKFILSHTNFNGKGALNTIRKSRKIVDSWRQKINPRLLQEIQNNSACAKVIQNMKHKIFSNINQTRNKNISLFIL